MLHYHTYYDTYRLQEQYLYLWKCSKYWPEYLPTNPTLYTVLNKLIFKYPLQRHFLVSTISLQLPSQLHNIWHDSCIPPLEAQLLKLNDGSKKSFFASCDFTTHSEFFKSAKKIIKLIRRERCKAMVELNRQCSLSRNEENKWPPQTIGEFPRRPPVAHSSLGTLLVKNSYLVFGLRKSTITWPFNEIKRHFPIKKNTC